MSLRANVPAQHPVRTQVICLVFRSHPQRLPKTQMQRTLTADGTTTFLRGRGGMISGPGSLHYGIRSQAWSQPRPQRWPSLPMQQITLRSCAPRRNDKSGRRNIWKEDNSSSSVDYPNWSALEMQASAQAKRTASFILELLLWCYLSLLKSKFFITTCLMYIAVNSFGNLFISLWASFELTAGQWTLCGDECCSLLKKNILHSVLDMVMGNGIHFYNNHSDNSCYGVMRNKMASCQQSSMIVTMYVELCVKFYWDVFISSLHTFNGVKCECPPVNMSDWFTSWFVWTIWWMFGVQIHL